MRKYKIEVLYPWDSTWYTLEHVGPFFTREGAMRDAMAQRLVYGHGIKLRVTKNGLPIWSD